MGTASFSVGKLARGASSSVLATEVITSGAHTTSGTPSNIEDGAGDIELAVGHILQVHVDTAHRINFGGAASSSTAGHYIKEDSIAEFECTNTGTVSITEV